MAWSQDLLREKLDGLLTVTFGSLRKSWRREQ